GCELVPCIERHALPWPAWPPAPLVFITSKAAAQRLISEWHGRPPGTRVAAVAPATRAALGAAGGPVDVSAGGGAPALAAAVGGPLDTLYPTSDVGTEQPEQTSALAVLEALGRVYRHVVYEVRAPAGLAERLRALGPCGYVFFSPSAVENVGRAGVVPAAGVC